MGLKVRIKKEMRFVAVDKKMLAYKIQKKILFWWVDVKKVPIAFSEQAANELLEWYKSEK